MTLGLKGDRQTALITGASGQDGSYLVERLLDDGWHVHGTVQSMSSTQRLHPDASRLELRVADLSDADTCRQLVLDTVPDAVFHFAGVSSVSHSWDEPLETAKVNGISAVALMEGCHRLQEINGREIRFVNASSAEIFAGTGQSPQNELTAIAPVNPYGASKAFAHNMVQTFRARGLHASNAIFYNHESPRRPTQFVTRKITAGVAAIFHGRTDILELGRLDVRRDWGWAPDYVDCAIRIAQHQQPDDFIVATGKSHSVEDFVVRAFHAVGISEWSRYVTIDRQLLRQNDSLQLVGDATRAREELGWVPTKTFQEVVEAMVQHDLQIKI
ncbi:GDP-mannose 4,6-dehydratase [Rhodococcus sp. JVH1]|uniref:GDP-mannose 4,6-dehydratase n=1 Tax=Rhodococcus sp. JVH1 TaxID=745408 RepID=UPI0005C160E8|nr:GDP-mannose 4,6-dehydratase [Rhodococcus sp. JVH1]